MIIRVDDEGEPLDEARLWVAFAHRFLEPDAYRHGTVVVSVMGLDAASAMAILLRRLRGRVTARDALACGEASSILLGEIEEVLALRS